MQNIVEHFRNKKFPREFEMSSETERAAKNLEVIYEKGELYGDDLLVSNVENVQRTVTDLANALSRDMKRHLGLSEDLDYGKLSFTVTYNGRIPIKQELGNGYCAYGALDFDTMQCVYDGIAAC